MDLKLARRRAIRYLADVKDKPTLAAAVAFLSATACNNETAAMIFLKQALFLYQIVQLSEIEFEHVCGHAKHLARGVCVSLVASYPKGAAIPATLSSELILREIMEHARKLRKLRRGKA